MKLHLRVSSGEYSQSCHSYCPRQILLRTAAAQSAALGLAEWRRHLAVISGTNSYLRLSTVLRNDSAALLLFFYSTCFMNFTFTNYTIHVTRNFSKFFIQNEHLCFWAFQQSHMMVQCLQRAKNSTMNPCKIAWIKTKMSVIMLWLLQQKQQG